MPKFFHTIVQRALPLIPGLNPALPRLAFLQIVPMSFWICESFLQILSVQQIMDVLHMFDTSSPRRTIAGLCFHSIRSAIRRFELAKPASRPNSYHNLLTGRFIGHLILFNDETWVHPAVILLDACFLTFWVPFRGCPRCTRPHRHRSTEFLAHLVHFARVGGALSVSCRHAVSSAVVGAISSPPSKHVTESSVPELSGSGTGTFRGSDVLGSSSWGNQRPASCGPHVVGCFCSNPPSSASDLMLLVASWDAF